MLLICLVEQGSAQCITAAVQRADYSVGPSPSGIAVADFNGDGRSDIAVGDFDGHSNTVSILLAGASGTFLAPTHSIAGGSAPWIVVAGDLNGDGRPDLVIGFYNGYSVSILLGNGDGTFRSPVQYGLPQTVDSIVVEDLDGDGHPDLAVELFAKNIHVLRGNGDGTFQAATSTGTGGQVGGGGNVLVAADFNGDGKPDLLESSYIHDARILIGNGDGTFQAAADTGTGRADRLGVADFNGDGHPDIASYNGNCNCNQVWVALGNGNGSFQPPVSYPANFPSQVFPSASGITIGDFNDDGHPDLACVPNNSSTFSILLGNGDGTFQGGLNYNTAIANDRPTLPVASDFNGDNRSDLVVRFSGYVSLYSDFVTGPIAYVNRTATGLNHGRSWSNAYKELRDALADAASNPCIKEVWVARGTYRPSLSVPSGGSRTASFQLHSNVGVYGGFIGTETLRSQRNATTNPTILSGDLNGDDPPISTDPTLSLSRGDNAYHVVTCSGADQTAILDGFTIANGFAYATPLPSQPAGAGMLIDSASPTVRNCIFTGNCAPATANDSGRGGAVASLNSSMPLFQSCEFDFNGALWGGAASIHGGQFWNCWFNGNVNFNNSPGHSTAGAAVVAESGAQATFFDCEFLRNKGSGGSVYCNSGSTVWLLSTQFLGNSTSFNGGCAGVFNNGANVTLADCLFVGNAAPSDASTPSAGVLWSRGGQTTLTNCTAASNVVDYGTAVLSDPTTAGTLAVLNSVLWGNTSGGLSAESAQLSASLGQLSAPQNISVSYSTIQGWTGSLGGTANNGGNPLFQQIPSPGPDGVWGTAEDDYGNVRPMQGSALLDTGNSILLPLDTFDLNGNGITTEPIPWDLDGSPRIQNATVDRGCYEGYHCPSCPNDRELLLAQSGSWSSESTWSISPPTACVYALLDVAGSPYSLSFVNGDAARGVVQTRGDATLSATSGSETLALKPPTEGQPCPSGVPNTARPGLTVSGTPADSPSLAITQGTVNASGGSIGDSFGDVGTLVVSGASSKLTFGAGALYVGNAGSGSLSVLNGAVCGGSSFFVGQADIEPHGHILVDGAGSILKPSSLLYINHGAVTITNGGAINGGNTGVVYIQPGSSVLGNGKINALAIENFGSITVQSSSGAGQLTGGFASITVTGQYLQLGTNPKTGDASGSLTLRYGQSGGLPVSDQLVVNGPATLAGSLVLTSTNSAYVPPTGSSFPVLTAASISGTFTVSQMPALAQGKFLLPSYANAYNRSNPSVSVLTQTLTGDITLNPTPSQGVPGLPKDAVLGDFDGFVDPAGHTTLDLAITVPDPVNPTTAPGSVVILRNAGVSGGNWQGFTLPTTIIPVGKDPRGLAKADFNADGSVDLAVCNFADNTVTVLTNTNAGTGAMNTAQTISLGAGAGPIAVSAADFRASGRMDLAVVNQTASTVAILNHAAAAGSASFTASQTLSTDAAPTALAVANFDNDSAPDIATANRDAGTVTVFFNRPGTHVFPVSPDTRLLAGDVPIDIQPGNIDNSKSRSLVCVNKGSGTLSFFLNDGSGVFSAGAPLPVGTSPVSLTMNDLDNDGDLDIGVVTTNASSQQVVRVLRNDLTGGVLTYTNFGDQYTSLDPRLVRSGDVDNNGRNDLVAVTNVSAVLRAARAPGKPSRVEGVDVLLAGPAGYEQFGRSQGPSATVQLSLAPAAPPPCPGDLNGDKVVNTFDLAKFLSHFGQSVSQYPDAAPADFTNDGIVNTFDLASFLSHFGVTCP